MALEKATRPKKKKKKKKKEKKKKKKKKSNVFEPFCRPKTPNKKEELLDEAFFSSWKEEDHQNQS